MEDKIEKEEKGESTQKLLLGSISQSISPDRRPPAGLIGWLVRTGADAWKGILHWMEERYRLRGPIEKILHKPVSAFERKWQHCFGGIALTLILLQLSTGIILSFYYIPSVDGAYESVVLITDEVPFGWLIRGIHHWSAYLLVVALLAHIIKVFVAGAYRPPREFTWVSGVLLLVVVLGFLGTGYLLPWHQTGYWATRVSMGLAGEIPVVGKYILLFVQGGYVIKQPALTRFFTAHVFLLPVVLVSLLVFHFFMIRRVGISRPL